MGGSLDPLALLVPAYPFSFLRGLAPQRPALHVVPLPETQHAALGQDKNDQIPSTKGPLHSHLALEQRTGCCAQPLMGTVWGSRFSLYEALSTGGKCHCAVPSFFPSPHGLPSILPELGIKGQSRKQKNLRLPSSNPRHPPRQIVSAPACWRSRVGKQRRAPCQHPLHREVEGYTLGLADHTERACYRENPQTLA